MITAISPPTLAGIETLETFTWNRAHLSSHLQTEKPCIAYWCRSLRTWVSMFKEEDSDSWVVYFVCVDRFSEYDPSLFKYENKHLAMRKLATILRTWHKHKHKYRLVT